MTTPPRRTIRMTLQYDGTRYHGWQTQPGGGTVQDAVEEPLGRILDHPVRVHGSGRTDRGVHARGQVASFETGSALPLDRILHGLNALLPPDIAATGWREMPGGFHARHSATAREYSYAIWRPRVCSPFARPFVHHQYRETLRLEAMVQAAERFVGRHDFTSFCAAGSAGEASEMEKDVAVSTWRASGPRWVYRIQAGSFLHHMVRNLVGTMIQVGLGRRAPRDMDAILEARDRRAAGPMAPARGLFLERVRYGEEWVGGSEEGG